MSFNKAKAKTSIEMNKNKALPKKSHREHKSGNKKPVVKNREQLRHLYTQGRLIEHRWNTWGADDHRKQDQDKKLSYRHTATWFQNKTGSRELREKQLSTNVNKRKLKSINHRIHETGTNVLLPPEQQSFNLAGPSVHQVQTHRLDESLSHQ